MTTDVEQAVSICGMPGCVEPVEGALIMLYADPLGLCADHLRPIRVAVLEERRRRATLHRLRERTGDLVIMGSRGG